MGSEAVPSALQRCPEKARTARGRGLGVRRESRPDGGIGEAIATALVERGLADRPIRRITAKDCYIPLGDAAKLMLPDEAKVVAGLRALMKVA